MTMFLGKISRDKRSAPKRISTPLPSNIVRRGDKFFRKENGKEEEIISSKVNFEQFFALKKTPAN